MLAASQASAQTISGNLTSLAGAGIFTVAANVSNLTFVEGGSPAYGGAGVLVCLEPTAGFPILPSTHTYDVVGAGSVVNATGFAARTGALIEWAVDNYFGAFQSGAIQGFSFNQLLWELSVDYNGTLASLNDSAGAIIKSPSIGPEFPAMLANLKSSYASIPDTYEATSFSVHFLTDKDPYYQNMALITAVPAVPEPSTYLMLFAGVGAMMVWRRRQER
jgi:hypothetical protein